MRKFSNLLGIAGAIGAVSLALAGCASGDSPAANNTNNSDGISVVTTTTQLDDFARQVTDGTGAQVTTLLQPGQSVHSFEPTAADLEALRNADVVIYNGVDLEPWLDDTLNSADFKGTRIDASAGIDVHDDDDDHDDHDGHDHGDDHGHDHDHDDDAHEHDHDDHDDDHGRDDDHGHHGHDHDHDHGGVNPHIWTSPSNAEDMVENVAKGLADADPDNAATYKKNAEAYNDKLDALDEWIEKNIDQIPEDKRLLVTNHDALHYFNDEYDVTFVGSIIPSWDDNAEPSAAELDELIAKIKEHKVPAIFTEQQLSPDTAKAIAEETGAKVYSGEDGLYTDALGPQGSAGETYIGSQIHNVTQLVDSWGGKVSEVPNSLKDNK
ncbi:metal ABC transporter substrate-binding protein [uncultured Gulosibacter sp.]|uniref:metal ABC transporter substrate-binding protein n=1 Tax=uncultured Gulosibacter sp. TaxID=1339167 RepID=UPI00288968FA|nr:metal ABC transporter substrate-binding protein [uncultured Gulosibacter sp.]